jgi:RNA polymerase sigma factor (sigma-70 family)
MVSSALVAPEASAPRGQAATVAAIEAAVRIESPRLIAGLARYTGDVGLAEELAQDSLVAALEQWPAGGVPRNPGAWLMTVGKRRAIDRFRRNRQLEHRYAEIGRDLDAVEAGESPELERVINDDIDDDLLRLVFIACHPALSMPARVALTLRLLGGLTTAEIARAYLVPEPTIAQRIVRAKRTLADAKVSFEVPGSDERVERLAAVLEVTYLIFNEGYTSTAGSDWTRPQLCQDAIRLGRVVATLMPTVPQVHGLVALMELQASRLSARTGPNGEPVLLLDQNRGRWDALLIRRGLAALQRAEGLGDGRDRYTLQAAIAACHARATRAESTDWARIVALYGMLAEVTPSPVVELNRAVAVSMAAGPQAGLDQVDELRTSGSLDGYHLFWSVRGDLLAKLGRMTEAAADFERAAGLTDNDRERELTLARAATARRGS